MAVHGTVKAKQKQGAPLNRTHPAKDHRQQRYIQQGAPRRNALFFFAGGVMSLLCLPRGKFSLAFLAVPAGKDGRVECPCQTVNAGFEQGHLNDARHLPAQAWTFLRW